MEEVGSRAIWVNDSPKSIPISIFASDGSIPRRAQARSMKTGMERQWTRQISDVSPEAIPRGLIVQSNKPEKMFFRFIRRRGTPGSITAAGHHNFQ